LVRLIGRTNVRQRNSGQGRLLEALSALVPA
jgi:hypothetical protein